MDTHAILHRAFHALPDFTSPTGVPTGALYGMVNMLLKIAEDFKPDYITACYDLPEPTHRHLAFDGYKANRPKTDESLIDQINRSKDILKAFNITVYQYPGFEADDILGTITEQIKDKQDLVTIIASGDMDTLQLVSGDKIKVYTLKKGINDTIVYNEEAVISRFGFTPDLLPDYKGLRGDPSDNIPGVVGIGEKGAGKLIVEFGSLDSIYSSLEKSEEIFLKKGFKPRLLQLLKDNKQEAEFSKSLATISRDAPIDYLLPAETWKLGIDADDLISSLNELGFRSLTNKIGSLLGKEEEVSGIKESVQIEQGVIDRLSLMVWLAESDKTNATYDEIIEYGRDKFNTTEISTIRNELERILRAQNLWQLYETIDEPLLGVVEKMQNNGIRLDLDHLDSLSKSFHKQLDKLEKDIHSLAETDFNINSPKQLGEVLFDKLGLRPKNQKRTTTGQRSTKESELEKMVDDHPIIPIILRFRELKKLVSTYVDALPSLVDETERIHSTFQITGTTTGRISSRDPNLQNIPIKTEEGRDFRSAFIPDPGHKLVSFDYSQIELRVAAILSADERLIDIFKQGRDIHASVASYIFKIEPEQVTSEMRRQAKVINFGILYGMGVNALRNNLGPNTSHITAKNFLEAYFHSFKGLKRYLEETKIFARKYGYTLTKFNRRRYFSGINSSFPFIRANSERKAINAPIQGTSADIMRLAMVNIDRDICVGNNVKMLLQVHDELVFSIEEKIVNITIPKIKKIMENIVSSNDSNDVPITVDVKVGDNCRDLFLWKG